MGWSGLSEFWKNTQLQPTISTQVGNMHLTLTTQVAPKYPWVG